MGIPDRKLSSRYPGYNMDIQSRHRVRGTRQIEVRQSVIGWLSQIIGLGFWVKEEATATNGSYVEQIRNFQGGTYCVF